MCRGLRKPTWDTEMRRHPGSGGSRSRSPLTCPPPCLKGQGMEWLEPSEGWSPGAGATQHEQQL